MRQAITPSLVRLFITARKLLFVLMSLFSINLQAQILPAVNADNSLNGAIYPSVENTGNFIASCDVCPDHYLLGMTWDGSNPGVAFTDGQITQTLSLPNGAQDPDIVIGQKGQVAMVVFESGSNVEYIIYTISTPLVPGLTPAITAAGTIETNASQPNADLNTANNLAVVWHKPNSTGTNPDIEYRVGDLFDWGIAWNGTAKPGDNKNTLSPYPQQQGYCYWPDIAISGGENYGVHVTFLENNNGVDYWWKMDDDFAPLPGGAIWYATLFNTTPSSNLTAPRIATSRGAFNRNFYNTVLADIDVNSTHHVMSVYNNIGGTIMADWPMFANGICNHAVVGWADDTYVNIAWSGEEPGATVDYDIAVKRLDQNGVPYDPTWAIANQGVSGPQTLPAISGLGLGLPFGIQPLFAYMWYDDNNELWWKVVPAPDVQLKKEPTTTTNTFTVYPNPASNHIAITLPFVLHASYRLKGLDGKTLVAGKIKYTQHKLMLGHLPGGTYLLEVSNDGSTVVEKVVIRN